VTISRSYSQKFKIEKSTKGVEQRIQGLSAGLVELLEKEIARRPWTDLLFPTHAGGHRSINSMRHALDECCKRAGVHRISFHGVRHSSATALALAGKSELQIQTFLGHADSRMCQVYVHLAGRMTDRTTANILGGIIEDVPATGGAEVIEMQAWTPPVGGESGARS
jgi:integrase